MPVDNTPNGALFFPFLKYLSGIGRAWKEELSGRAFRFKLLSIPGIFVLYSAFTQPLCGYVQLRKGIRLDDKLLSFVPVMDCSLFIFLLLYSSMFIALAAHLRQPKVVLRILEMQLLMAVSRQICILLIPLEPPSGFLLLRDVFLENTFYPHQVPMTKDLFFSGHVGCLWVYFLCVQRRNLKIFLGVATALMSIMLLSMRVHYSYDVWGAVAITSFIYLLAYGFRYKDQSGLSAKTAVSDRSVSYKE
jgi:hypothetical protein